MEYKKIKDTIMEKLNCPVCKMEKEFYEFVTCGAGNQETNFEISICKDCWENASDEDISNAIALFEQISVAHKDFTSDQSS